MVMLLPDGVTQSMMPVAVGVDPLMHLMMKKLLLLQRVFMQRTCLYFLELLVGFSSRG
jgi:hypothetical protein